MTQPKYTAADLVARLRRHYHHILGCVIVEEVSIGHRQYERGYKTLSGTKAEKSVRRIDALVMFTDKRWAVEIKVSLTDLKRELATPEKQKLWADHTDAFYFLVTPALLEYAKTHVPKQYGIMVVDFVNVHEKTWGDKIPWTFTDPIKVVRNAKKNLEPLSLPYTTTRRMAVRSDGHRKEIELLREKLAAAEKRLAENGL